MKLIDTHCHLYLPEFENDLNDLIQRAQQNGLDKIFLPAIDSETHERLIALSEFRIQNSEFRILPMMGLHPCSVKENFEAELKIVEQYLNSETKFYAVGEIGLDYYWDLSFKAQQLIAFERQIEMAIAGNLPIVIHSRKSTQNCIDVVKKFAGRVKGIFHCFGGTLDEAKQIIDLGFYLGIGGVVTYKNSGLKEVLQQLSLENLVLETDAPYLTPVPHRGKRNEPSYTKLVCESIALALNKTNEEVAEVTSRNAQLVFQMN
ncbi:MAG: TatD family hydrolase [Bacteroidetes bacterium]|nr:TatD family hydrolase [Bacteroidota bacterium]